MKSILVIDDDPKIVRLIARTLAQEGFLVEGALTEKEGLELIGGPTFLDLAIVDFWLGQGPSINILDKIESHRSDLPIIVMSGGSGWVPIDVSHSVSTLSGATKFLQKPFTRNELLSIVRAILD